MALGLGVVRRGVVLGLARSPTQLVQLLLTWVVNVLPLTRLHLLVIWLR